MTEIESIIKITGPVLKAKTRSSGVTFAPAATHDMVRSLFDPTLKKSFLECCITFTIIADFVICYWLVQNYGMDFTRRVFLAQYVLWRICYNLGIGIFLHFQSKTEFLTKYVKDKGLFKKGNRSKLARFFQFEISSKMDKSYNLFECPEEFNGWLLFRQFVDLILMQDFTNYIIYVYLSLPESGLELFNWRTLLGSILIAFNVWVKLDAHRVVKDYAWYWGDFFFLQESELIFDGVFNISPHPMYSIGYLGYYGVSLICGDYHVLLVSIWGHILQFIFLKYVETPHIEKIYGGELDNELQSNSFVDDLIAKENYDYSRPLITTGFNFTNFDILRFTDYFTVSTVASVTLWCLAVRPSNKHLFMLTLIAKILSWSIISTILYRQSRGKWFTKLYLKNGYTQIYSYQQWQFIYNFSFTLTTTLLGVQTIAKISELYPQVDYSQIIFGIILCAIQVWCNSEIRSAISDFGWFYGDFFLINYISEKHLTSQGIFRYLNNPEAILGIAGVWGTTIMTDFCYENIILALTWSLANFVFIKFVEEPHVTKVYGNDTRISGVDKTLLKLKPFRMISDIVDDIGTLILKSILLNKEFEKSEPASSFLELDLGIQDAIYNVTSGISPSCKFEIGDHEDEKFILPNQIKIQWQIPSELYHEQDWIGLYNVLETRTDRYKTKVSSFGHWSATCKTGYKNHIMNSESVESFTKTEFITQGIVKFDKSLLNFEPGIYEFRYHSKNTHDVFLSSHPFQIKYLKIESIDPITVEKFILSFLEEVGSLKSGNFDDKGNRFFKTKAFSNFIQRAIGTDISTDYIKRVNGDVKVISRRICEIKTILDSLV